MSCGRRWRTRNTRGGNPATIRLTRKFTAARLGGPQISNRQTTASDRRPTRSFHRQGNSAWNDKAMGRRCRPPRDGCPQMASDDRPQSQRSRQFDWDLAQDHAALASFRNSAEHSATQGWRRFDSPSPGCSRHPSRPPWITRRRPRIPRHAWQQIEASVGTGKPAALAV
jgi:hypothetical protein